MILYKQEDFFKMPFTFFLSLQTSVTLGHRYRDLDNIYNDKQYIFLKRGINKLNKRLFQCFKYFSYFEYIFKNIYNAQLSDFTLRYGLQIADKHVVLIEGRFF